MLMFGWILRILVLLLVLRLILRFARGVMQGLQGEGPGGPRRTGGASTPSVPLVKDPVCGTYVPRTRALVATTAEGTHYFCSETCREQYVRGARR